MAQGCANARGVGSGWKCFECGHGSANIYKSDRACVVQGDSESEVKSGEEVRVWWVGGDDWRRMMSERRRDDSLVGSFYQISCFGLVNKLNVKTQ